MFQRLWWGLCLIFVSVNAYAERPGIGGVAENMMTPVSIMSDFINSACLLLGIAFVFAGIIKYFEHRRSPLMITLGTPVTLFIMGVILLLLPLLRYYTESGLN